MAGPQPANTTQLPDQQLPPTDDSNIPILEDSDEEDEVVSALSADSLLVPEPLNRFIPQSFYEAYELSHHHLWFPAMEKEIQHWDDCGVVMPVARPPGIKVIQVRWVFDEKTDGVGLL